MPIVTITVRKPKSREFKATVLDAVHAALVSAGVNPNDRIHRVLELDAEDFQYDPTFPDVRTARRHMTCCARPQRPLHANSPCH